VHSTGTIAQFNTTSATGNTYIAFQRTGTGLWRIGDTYNAGNNFFELHNTVLGVDAMEFEAATNKSTFQAQQTYTTGLARGNYFDYNLSVAAGGSFSSPNAITALTATLDLTLAGNATIPSGARSGLDAYNTIAFTGAGTLTHNQGTQIRAYSNVTAGWAFAGSAVGTITHLAGLRALFPDNSGSAVNVTNNYALLLNDQTANTGTVTYTNRWGVYQEGLSDTNYFNGTTLIRTTTIAANGVLQVAGSIGLSGNTQIRQATNSDGNTLQIFATQFVAGNLNSISYGYTGGALIASVSPGDTITLFDSGRNTATDGRVKVLNTSSANTALSVEKNGVYTLYATTAGQVGIGTNTPYTALNVSGTGVQQITLTSTNAGTQWQNFGIRNTSGTLILNSINDAATGSYAAYKITKNTSDFTINKHEWYTNNELLKMILTSAGEVGIGTGTPQYIFHAVSANTTIGAFRISSAANGQLLVGNSLSDTGIRTLATGDSIVFSDTSRYLAFGTGGATERARITSGGNFLIGTTTDNGDKLQVAGNATFVSGGSLTQLNIGKTSSGYAAIRFINDATFYSWILASQYNVSNAFEITPSTVVGGSTFTTPVFKITNAGNSTTTGSITTGAPTTGTAAAWKLGSRVAATVALDTTQYIEVDIGGTLYKLAIVT
jgi:hypothetical protein